MFQIHLKLVQGFHRVTNTDNTAKYIYVIILGIDSNVHHKLNYEGWPFKADLLKTLYPE